MEEQRIIRRMTLVGVVGNVLLTAFKLFAGIYGHSGAMVSDAVHSLSDVFATCVAFIGTRLSMRPADREHPYGHERIECAASCVLGAILLMTGLGIGKAGVVSVLSAGGRSLSAPGMIALVAALVSIVAKEGMFWYTRHYARILNSPAFLADAWHHRSDALSSVGSLIGIGGAMLGHPVLDPLASVVICGFILKVSFDVINDALRKMLDTSRGAEYEDALRDFAAGQEGVEGVDMVHSRMFGNRVYVDLEIEVDPDKTVGEGHEIAERVHRRLEERFGDVKHVMVHVNPAKKAEKPYAPSPRPNGAAGLDAQ